ncbi:PEP/pyruvate-binding domain-containing protein [Ktedonospora formicarum]|uniref:Phosphoenolpyruvate synthase n=1 Tax=Ktedonospora formicarum TaxID=2778364 RepID=A0A8J3IAT5_9CHLR|nr:PEP/pyruvate-binding domain-containing protein [Ktedonospora formicarum]GHO47904.1 phosphoenolpyruvate synthase [Ktedonospora formicarum]
MNGFILPFQCVDESMLARVGGKGANLGALTQTGFPVPPGFCITTSAYKQVTGTLDLDATLDELAATPASDQARLHELAATMRTRLLATSMPEEVGAAIQEAYRELAGDEALPVAVRSSATAEDLPFASFAGQQDTYLHVVGVEAVLDAVRRCWGSLWTDRAVSYRASNGIDPHSVQLAVVVQSMVEAQVAGILFTANPLTGKRNQAVIDANPGLGESVVSGAVNPDHFVVNTSTGEVVEQHIGEKKMLIRGTAGGGTEHVTLEASQEVCLDEHQLEELAKLGQRVEEYYHAPQDIEWALDDQHKLWLTQARPITTLYPLPACKPTSPETLHAYFSFNVAQGVFRPLTPMGASIFRRIGSEVATLLGMPPHIPGEPTFMLEAGMRLYLDMTTPFSNRLGRPILTALMGVMEARSQPILEELSHDKRFPLTKKSRPASLLFLARILLRVGILRRVLYGFRHPEQAMRMRADLVAELEQKAHIPEHASAEQRLAKVEELCSTFPANIRRILTYMGPAMISTLLTYRLLDGIASGDEIQTTMRSLPLNVTTEMDLELWSLAQKIQRDAVSLAVMRGANSAQITHDYREGKLPPVLAEGLASFLRTYGHRGVAEIDMGLPRWSEQPEPIIEILGNYLNHTQPEQAPDIQFERGAREAEEMMATLRQRARQKSWLRGKALNFAFSRMRALLGIREFPKFFVIKTFAYARAHLWAIGEELVRAQRLEKAGDIFFLYLPEVRTALNGQDFREIVRARHDTYAYELRRKHVPRVLLSDGTDPETLLSAPHAEGGDSLRGIAASPGRVTGRARVILDPAGARLEQGEILVAPSTDPGWTPLFLTASALVMEMGGPMSHGSVVAREYGIPAVVGVPHATDRLTTGQLITVDGISGTVSIEPEERGHSENADGGQHNR